MLIERQRRFDDYASGVSALRYYWLKIHID